MEFTLPFPPSTNTYWRKFNNRMVISEKGRAFRKAVLGLVNCSTVQFTADKKLKVEIIAYRPDKRKRDLDNLLKATLDSLMHANVYEDDSQIVDLRICWGETIGGYLKVQIWSIQ